MDRPPKFQASVDNFPIEYGLYKGFYVKFRACSHMHTVCIYPYQRKTKMMED